MLAGKKLKAALTGYFEEMRLERERQDWKWEENQRQLASMQEAWPLRTQEERWEWNRRSEQDRADWNRKWAEQQLEWNKKWEEQVKKVAPGTRSQDEAGYGQRGVLRNQP